MILQSLPGNGAVAATLSFPPHRFDPHPLLESPLFRFSFSLFHYKQFQQILAIPAKTKMWFNR